MNKTNADEAISQDFDLEMDNASQVNLIADHYGLLKLGDKELPCCVLNNKQRVLIMREVLNLLTGNRKGGLERYVNASGVREYMPPKFVGRSHREAAIPFRITNGIAYGYEAEDVILICDAYLKARENKKLHPTQYHLAKAAEIFIRSCAKVGLVALIDEATGYQAVRDADELQVKLQAYISNDLTEWTRTFPIEFFHNLYRLEGMEIPVPPQPYPKRFGRYVMRFVYDTLDKDVADWLRKNNPNPQGHEHHHQWLTKEFGQPKLKFHLMEVLGIMKASTTMETYKENLARAFVNERANRRARLSRAKAERKSSLSDSSEVGQQLTMFEMDYI